MYGLLRICQGSRGRRATGLALAGTPQENRGCQTSATEGKPERGLGSLGRTPGSLGARGLGCCREDCPSWKAPVSRVTLVSKREDRMGFLCAVDGVGGGLSQERDGGGRNERGHKTWRRCLLCKLARQQMALILGGPDKETAYS